MRPLPTVKTEILVIGHGISGLTTASMLASEGRDVLVVGSGTTSTSLSTSCLSTPGPLSDEDARYALESLKFIIPRLESVGLPLVGGLGRHEMAITHIGSQYSCLLRPKFTASIDGGKKISFLGLHGHPDLDSDLAGSNLAATGIRSEGVWVRLPNTENEMSSSQFSKSLNDGAIMHLKDALDDIECDMVAIPPLFPLKNHVSMMKSLQTSRKKVKETVTPLSLPGLRLQEALELASLNEGVQLSKGREVQCIRFRGGEARAAMVTSGLREQKVEFSNLVIASGDITLTSPRSTFLSSLKRRYGSSGNAVEKALMAGVDVRNLRAHSGRRSLSNVFVCGAALPGNSFARGNGMLGAILSSTKVSKEITGGS